MKNQGIAKFFAVFGLLVVPTLFPACERRGGNEKSTQKEESKPAITLATEVRKVLQGGEYREETFRPLIADSDWLEVRKIIEAEADACGLEQKATSVLGLKLDLSTLQTKLATEEHRKEIERSRERQKKTLEGIQKELQQMAEEEGLKPH